MVFLESNPVKKYLPFAGFIRSLTTVKFSIPTLVVEAPELTHRNSKFPSVDQSVLRHLLRPKIWEPNGARGDFAYSFFCLASSCPVTLSFIH